MLFTSGIAMNFNQTQHLAIQCDIFSLDYSCKKSDLVNLIMMAIKVATTIVNNRF